MKKLLFAILLTTLCASISKITAQTKDSLSLSPNQVENVYKGLKQGEIYKIKYHNCLEASIKLDSIIQDQHKKTLLFTSKLSESQADLAEANQKLVAETAENERLKAKKTPLYMKPWLWATLGFVGGVYVSSK